MKTLKKCRLFLLSFRKMIFLFSILLLSSIVQANNLTITGIAVNQTTQNVTFTLSWDNSWNITTTPNNWDAVWVFVKWRLCSNPTADYTHGTLSATTANHSYTNLQAMTTPCSAGIGGCGGADVTQSAVQGLTLDFTQGIMLRKTVTDVLGTVTSDVSLKITNLPAAGIDISTSVFAIEMVYVPQNNFYLGDATAGILGATNRFTDGSRFVVPGDLLSPYVNITAAYETGAQTFFINAPAVGAGTQITGVPAVWPKGQYGFYIMKYEISEGQYAEFLNTLSSAEQTIRWPGNYNTNRNRLNLIAGVASTDRPDRAQNYLIWSDIAAYLDWACLRPMTEMEYEKACRGTATPALAEMANSASTATVTAAVNFSGAENGTETFTAGNTVTQSQVYTNGDAGTTGPARCGIFATGSSTRTTANASYYGVMDLTGNVREFVVALAADVNSAVSSTQTGNILNVFDRRWGDGDIATGGGLHNVTNWPISTVATLAANTTNIIGQKGGDWATTLANVAYNQVSSRFLIYNTTTAINNTIGARTNYCGGRGVR